MKKYVMIIITMVILLCTQAKSQGFFSSFFSQKKAMLKNAAAQIAALKVYGAYLQKGYDIAHKGLNTISDIKKGDLNLHNTFFTSLRQVNPKIKKYGRIADLIDLNIKTIQAAHAIGKLGTTALFNPEENTYIQGVTDRLLSALSDTLTELITLVTDDQLEMKDDERIDRIDKLCADAEDEYEFSQDFKNDVAQLAYSRQKEQNDINVSRILNGLE